MLPASCPYVQDVQRQREQTVQKTRKHSEFDLTEEHLTQFFGVRPD